MDLGIEGNSALVLASSSGLGKASAKSLLNEGCNVVINGRDKEKLEDSVKELKKVGEGNVHGLQGDITEKKDIERLVKETVEINGGLDHLVTCAGGPPSGSFLDTTDEDWYNAFDLLVMSVVRIVRESVEYLKQDGGGTIVNITSISVKEAIESLVLSNSVRMSVIGLEKTLSKELGPEIRVNAILPGPHETERIQDLIKQGMERGEFGSYQDGLNFWTEDVPLERIGEPMELGELVAYLSSEKSSYINGTAIPIDGGASKSNL
ncbi:MAG: SDR family oxidoreductase [Thermoplasmatota archaeon]